MIVSPFIVVYPTLYEECYDENRKLIDCSNVPDSIEVVESVKNDTLYKIELIIDIIWVLEILMNFVKKTRLEKTIQEIAMKYLQGFFLIDVLATFPPLISNEYIRLHIFKLIRISHLDRLTEPL